MANELGDKIYELRKRKNLTQEDISLALGISDKSISKWENGITRPSIENLKRLSSILDISLDELLSLGENQKNKKKIFKIVLTGGPCAGKTTAMNWITNHFPKFGYKVLFVPEAATELITGGLAPWEALSNQEYQSGIIDTQMSKEQIFMRLAENIKEDKVLIVCDRGVLDNKVYMSKKDFKYLMKSKGLEEGKIRDSYDAVFHLVTAAKGAKEFYNLDNPARIETIDEAIRIDDALINAWTGHPHFRIIDNNTNFEEKMKRLVREIAGVLGEPNPYEIERKFLIDMPDLEYLESLPNCKKVRISQTYLKSGENEEIRIRQRGVDGSYTYSKTKKIEIDAYRRIEIEERLSEKEYINEFMNADTSRGQIIKDRYCLSWNGMYFEIDVYPFWTDRAICEIELLSLNDRIAFPDFISVIEEVTENFEYRNSELAKRMIMK